MPEFFLHFFIGLSGSLAIFAVFYRLSAAETTSVPFGLVFFGLACGVLGVYVSPWSTPAALLVYCAVSLEEHLEEQRRAKKDPGSGSSTL